MDFVLIVQVLVNLLDNSLKYAPLDSAILLDVSAAGHELIFSVRDSGAGVPKNTWAVSSTGMIERAAPARPPESGSDSQSARRSWRRIVEAFGRNAGSRAASR